MGRSFAFAWSIAALSGAAAAAAQTIVTRSHHGGNYAEVIQTGPQDDQPVVETQSGPGWVSVEQRGRYNHSIVIQSE